LIKTIISYSTTVLYSRDSKGVGAAWDIMYSNPKTCFMATRQYWLKKSKHKNIFRSIEKVFIKIFKKIIQWGYCLPAYLV